ncbi:MAG: threonine--tRNA ligase [Rickettsiales bacterium]|jgi:threonyl-tRNA synthetase|nr:threonine--tRNA ligase [Rickettsiales bacterium]
MSSSEIELSYLGRVLRVSPGSNGFHLLKTLGGNLAKEAVAMTVNGKTLDLATSLTDTMAGSTIDFIGIASREGLSILRHSSAHMLAYAVQELRGDGVKFALGPVIEDGFYYDFDVEDSFSVEDLGKIEAKIVELVQRGEKFLREEWSRESAIRYFEDRGQLYKVELIRAIPADEAIGIYRVGNFVDLCRGVHVPSAGYMKHIRLLKVAGAYWRGDSKNKMLQRIYGTSWDTEKNLENYRKMLEEAERRDHKKICRAMDLAHFEHEFASGAPFYHPNGLFLFNTLVGHMRKKQEENGYLEVSTPRLMDRSLWEISGHWKLYGEHNYSGKTEDGKQFCVKPMNCPGGILIYRQGIKSYRDLPLRMAEFGKVNRYEASGALNGFLRVREFTQDDAHIFCTPEQLGSECEEVIKFILNIYRDFGFGDSVRIKLSTRPKNRIGDDSLWDMTEKSLADTLDRIGLEYSIFPGEGAFYGPKLEFVLKDALGRDWQTGTLQLDMNLPKRFDINYIDRNGERREPVMLHRAILGSIERFLGVLIEHTEGKFPLWLNPLEVCVATVVDEVRGYGEMVLRKLKDNGIRAILDASSEKIGYKIREMSLRKIPYLLILGKNEESAGNVSVRIFGEQLTKTLILDEFIRILKAKVESKSRDFSLE